MIRVDVEYECCKSQKDERDGEPIWILNLDAQTIERGRGEQKKYEKRT